MSRVRAVGIVVPARDEEDAVVECLRSVRRAADAAARRDGVRPRGPRHRLDQQQVGVGADRETDARGMPGDPHPGIEAYARMIGQTVQQFTGPTGCFPYSHTDRA